MQTQEWHLPILAGHAHVNRRKIKPNAIHINENASNLPTRNLGKNQYPNNQKKKKINKGICAYDYECLNYLIGEDKTPLYPGVPMFINL